LREGSGGEEDPVWGCPGGGAWDVLFGTGIVSLWFWEVEGSEEPSVEEMGGVSWEGWVDISKDWIVVFEVRYVEAKGRLMIREDIPRDRYWISSPGVGFEVENGLKLGGRIHGRKAKWNRFSPKPVAQYSKRCKQTRTEGCTD